MAKFILWAPRVIAFLIVAFIVLMAFDNFTPGTSSGKQMQGFVVSISPALVLITGMAVAWRYKLAGGIIVVTLGIIMTVLFQTYKYKQSFLLLSTPVLVTGILYILSYFYEKVPKQK